MKQDGIQRRLRVIRETALSGKKHQAGDGKGKLV